MSSSDSSEGSGKKKVEEIAPQLFTGRDIGFHIQQYKDDLEAAKKSKAKKAKKKAKKGKSKSKLSA